MNTYGDYSDEMPSDPHFDDMERAEWLRPFAEEVRFAVSGPVPPPSPMLAAVLAVGVSIDKGDLLVTAASKVPGPASQVSGLPKWRKEDRPMPIHTAPAGIFSALLAKLASVGTVAKAAVAGVTAAATLSIAGAAAGVLPSPAQGAITGAVNAVSPLNLPVHNPAAAVNTGLGAVNGIVAAVPPSVLAGASAQVTTPAGTAKAGVSANVTAPIPSVPGLGSLPLPTIPSVAGIRSAFPIPLPALPACVTNLIPVGSVPDPTRLVTQIPACVQSVLASTGLPVDVSNCVASVLATVEGVLSPSSIGSLPKLNVSACVPFDLSKCTSNTMSAMGGATMTASIPFVGDMVAKMFASIGGIPGLSNVAGCIPFNIQGCISSIVGAIPGIVGTASSVGTGTGPATLPSLNLSACLPTGITAGIPGLPAGVPGIPGLGAIPGIGSSTPFFGNIPFLGGGIPFFGSSH